MGITVVSVSSRAPAERQLDETVPLEAGEQVVLRLPIRHHRPSGGGVAGILRSIVEASGRGILLLTDRRLILLRVRLSGPNLVYVIPRSSLRGVAPAGRGSLRLLCDDPALPPEMTGIKAGLTVLETGVAGGLGGGGAAGVALGGAVGGGARAMRGDQLRAVLERELGSVPERG